MLGICLAALPVVFFTGEKIAVFFIGRTASFADKQLIVALLYAGLIALIYPWLLYVRQEQLTHKSNSKPTNG